MRNIFWLIIVILFIGWAIGFFAFGQLLGEAIHILLLIALVAIVLQFIERPNKKV